MHINMSRDLWQDPWFLVGLSLTLLFAGLALLGPPLAPFDPWDISFTPISSPSAAHLLGINDGGQDIFSELLYAIRNTVAFGLLSGFTALVIGVLIGAISGWFGGFVDAILMRIADIILAIPAIMILILTAALFQPASYIFSPYLGLSDVANHRQGDQGTDSQSEGRAFM